MFGRRDHCALTTCLASAAADPPSAWPGLPRSSEQDNPILGEAKQNTWKPPRTHAVAREWSCMTVILGMEPGRHSPSTPNQDRAQTDPGRSCQLRSGLRSAGFLFFFFLFSFFGVISPRLGRGRINFLRIRCDMSDKFVFDVGVIHVGYSRTTGTNRAFPA